MTRKELQALGGLNEFLTNMDASLRGRRALVTASNGHMVQVKTLNPTTGLMEAGDAWYPATHTNLATNTVGVLQPIEGGSFLFAVIGSGAAGSVGAVVISATAPTDPAAGTMWLDPTT